MSQGHLVDVISQALSHVAQLEGRLRSLEERAELETAETGVLKMKIDRLEKRLAPVDAYPSSFQVADMHSRRNTALTDTSAFAQYSNNYRRPADPAMSLPARSMGQSFGFEQPAPLFAPSKLPKFDRRSFNLQGGRITAVSSYAQSSKEIHSIAQAGQDRERPNVIPAKRNLMSDDSSDVSDSNAPLGQPTPPRSDVAHRTRSKGEPVYHRPPSEADYHKVALYLAFDPEAKKASKGGACFNWVGMEEKNPERTKVSWSRVYHEHRTKVENHLKGLREVPGARARETSEGDTPSSDL